MNSNLDKIQFFIFLIAEEKGQMKTHRLGQFVPPILFQILPFQ